jgi:predicted regulator of Ras-like GTPase activity (Roadblock/LC7/MglB family)
MSNALQALNQIPGVIGSVIFNAQDECVVSMMPPPYEPMLLSQVMQELRNALNVLNYLADSASWGAIVIRYDAGYLVVRNVNAMTVMVIAQPSLNPAMLSVGFNVAALKLTQESAQPAAYQPTHAPPPPTPSYGRAPTAGAPQASMMMPNQPTHAPPPLPLPPQPHAPPPPPSPAMTLSGTQSQPINLSQSGPRLASSSMSGSHGSIRGDSVDGGLGGVPDAVGKVVIDGLLRALARQIGPFAKLIMKEELTKLGVTGATLGYSQYDDFINMLSRRLQDPAKRREFMTEAEALPGKR